MDILEFILRCEEKAIRWSPYRGGWILSALPPPPPQLLLRAPHQSQVPPLLTVGMVSEITGLKSPVLALALWQLSTP